MALMVKQAFEKGKRVLILTHRMELFKSTLKHFGNAGIPCVSLEAGNKMPIGDWRVMLAMEKTIWNKIKRGENILPIDLIIGDEIHYNNFTKIIEHFPAAYLIGFSATPTGKHICKIYTDIINNIDIPELINQRWLVPCRAYQMQDNFDDVKISKGEFEDKSLFQHFNTSKLYKGIIDEYRTRALGKKTIVFCVNVEHTKATWQTFVDAGFLNVRLVHSKMDERVRRCNIDEFERMPSGIMINCGILTTGYDHPPVECIIVYRATTSLPLWLQMQGRGSRPHEGKDEFICLDFGQNHTRLGLWNQQREWTLLPPKKRKALGSAPVRSCPTCSAMLHASARKCEFCGFVFSIVTTELREGVMCEITSGTPLSAKGKRISDLSIEQLIELQKVKRMKSSYIWRVMRARGTDALKIYREQMGYNPYWLIQQMQKLQAGETQFSNYIIK